ncbi:hypothetical protein [Ruminococcus sp. 25CYCFAH16]
MRLPVSTNVTDTLWISPLRLYSGYNTLDYRSCNQTFTLISDLSSRPQSQSWYLD